VGASAGSRRDRRGRGAPSMSAMTISRSRAAELAMLQPSLPFSSFNSSGNFSVTRIRGKTLRGSKKSADGSGASHLLSAYACPAGLVILPHAVDGKTNAIKAIPELLERLASTGAIVSIDAIGTPTAIDAKIVEQEADDVVAPNGNQTSPSRANA
jgi:hypothetical protein